MNLNADIWLYVLALLPLRDAISFTWVSREFRALTLEKTFWISLLSATKASRALPCPEDEDLAYHSIFELTSMAFHVLSLERNWARRYPSIRRLETINLGPSHRILHAILGTPLVVVHSALDGNVTCWNVDAQSALQSVYVGRSVFHVSLVSRHHVTKVCSMAILVTDDLVDDYSIRPSYLAVITIPTASPYLMMEVPFRQELGTGFTFGQLFLNHQVVGLLRVFGMERLDIVAFNRSSGACTLIKTDTFYDHKLGAFLDDSLYIVKHRDDSSNVYNCPSYLLPYNDPEGETHVTETLDWDGQGIRFSGAVDAAGWAGTYSI
ncbi:hypothetical protein B0H14DRAFT_3148651 [Mycena olivaceomarginata]|nr:hypothetical protein B0H14DRAFT_3148651 [Mycena olivaceomarginata]